MKQRLLTGWNIQRVLFVIMGSIIIAGGIADRQWISVIFGGYFASMGLFSFGCASGYCFREHPGENVSMEKDRNSHGNELEEMRVRKFANNGKDQNIQ